MSTFAQIMIEKGIVGKEKDSKNTAVARACLRYVQDALNPPKETPGHALDVRNLKMKAERFRFEEDPREAASNLIKEKSLDMRTVYETARLPAPVVWIEYSPDRALNDGTRCDNWGALIVDQGKEWDIICCMQGPNGHGAAYLLGKMLPVPVGKGVQPEASLHWFCDVDMSDEQKRLEFEYCVLDIIVSLFFLMVPRISEIREPVSQPRLQKAREKRGKPPIVEIKKVKLAIGIGRTRYVRQGVTGSAGMPGLGEVKKRLHPVIGHLRVYRKKQGDSPLVSWVPHHFRGNPELGIVMHDREVVDKKRSSE